MCLHVCIKDFSISTQYGQRAEMQQIHAYAMDISILDFQYNILKVNASLYALNQFWCLQIQGPKLIYRTLDIIVPLNFEHIPAKNSLEFSYYPTVVKYFPKACSQPRILYSALFIQKSPILQKQTKYVLYVPHFQSSWKFKLILQCNQCHVTIYLTKQEKGETQIQKKYMNE